MRSRVSRRPWHPPPLTRLFAPARHAGASVATAYELVVPSGRPSARARPLGATAVLATGRAAGAGNGKVSA